MQKDAVASLRAGAYQALRHFETALLFQRLAALLNPGDLRNRIGLIEIYCQLERWEEAFLEAPFLLANPAASPEMKRLATQVLSLIAVPAEERRSQNNFAVASRLQDAATEQESRELLAA